MYRPTRCGPSRIAFELRGAAKPEERSGLLSPYGRSLPRFERRERQLAQPPSQLQPFESPLHYLGAEMRAWRTLRGYSLARLGSIVHVSGDLLGKIEKAQRRPTVDLIERCDQALNASGTLRRLHDLTLRAYPEPGEVDAARERLSLADDTGRELSEQPDPIGYENVAGVASLAAYRRRRRAGTDHRARRGYSVSGDWSNT